MTRGIECTENRIRALVAHSTVPEDPVHAENTLKWLLTLDPAADEALLIAALGHDVERAVLHRRVQKAPYPSFEAYKAAHAENSARILGDIMVECGVEPLIREEVCRVVTLHETGGDARSDMLKDADSLSFFHVNLPYYAARNDRETIERRGAWGYQRLSARARAIVQGFSYEDPELNVLLTQLMCADLT
jgi:hypothetical protein